MINGSSTIITSDRRGNLNEALNLNNGYAYVPLGVYFSSAFTITAWIYPSQLQTGSRLIDFANGPSNDNIVISLKKISTNTLYFEIYNSGNRYATVEYIALIENQWLFLSLCYDGTSVKIYFSGTVAGSSTFSNFMPNFLNRAKNYIGKSNWNGDGVSTTIIDELRIYNRCLSQTEINSLMNF
jgi:hypothetical protein